MEIFAFGITAISGVFLFVLGLVMLLTVFGLPGNWIMLILVAVWHFVLPMPSALNIWYWIIVLAIAVLGEVMEFFLQVKQAKKYGSSNTGTVGGVIGAIVGAILLAPFLFGIGAFIGAMLGAWCGCFVFELLRGMDSRTAARAALGAMFGRFLGTVTKLGCGVVIWAITMQYIWPDPQNLPFHFRWLPEVPQGPLPHDGPMSTVLGFVQSLVC